MKLVVLVNKGKTRVDVSLLHDHCCAIDGACTCVADEYLLPSGKKGNRMLPASVSIAPKGTSEPLSSSVLHLPQVIELRRRRVLVAQDVLQEGNATLPPVATRPPVLA